MQAKSRLDEQDNTRKTEEVKAMKAFTKGSRHGQEWADDGKKHVREEEADKRVKARGKARKEGERNQRSFC